MQWMWKMSDKVAGAADNADWRHWPCYAPESFFQHEEEDPVYALYRSFLAASKSLSLFSDDQNHPFSPYKAMLRCKSRSVKPWPRMNEHRRSRHTRRRSRVLANFLYSTRKRRRRSRRRYYHRCGGGHGRQAPPPTNTTIASVSATPLHVSATSP